jgi:hypothetical protein
MSASAHPLLELEKQAAEEGRGYGRERLRERLQQIADQQGSASPGSGQRLSDACWRDLPLDTTLGRVTLRAHYGYDRQSQRWMFPVKELPTLLPGHSSSKSLLNPEFPPNCSSGVTYTSRIRPPGALSEIAAVLDLISTGRSEHLGVPGWRLPLPVVHGHDFNRDRCLGRTDRTGGRGRYCLHSPGGERRYETLELLKCRHGRSLIEDSSLMI